MTDHRPAPGRVLHVVRRAGEPSQTFILETILALRQRGWHTDVLSLLEPIGAGLDLPLVPIPKAGLRRRVRRRALGETEHVAARHAAAAAVDAVEPDLLHVHFGWTATQLDIGALGVPAVVSFHGSDVNAWPHRDPANLAAYAELFGKVRHATVVSDLLARRLRDLGFTGDIEVIPAGVGLGRFTFRTPVAEAQKPRLLFVGRLVSCKGLDTLIAALPAVVEGSPGVRLDVIGDGELRAESERRATELGMAGRVCFHGARSHEQVAQAMRDADVLVVPSRRSAEGEEEGSPVAPKEALATGVPVVATAVGGIPDIIPPEYRDELVAPDDPLALAGQVLHILHAPQHWARRAEVGRTWVQKRFDADRLADRLEALYGALAQRPG